MFGGPGEGINLVAMNKQFNGTSGEWYKLEQTLKGALDAGSDVRVKIDLVYDGVSKRPEALNVRSVIDGVVTEKAFMNQTGN